MTETLGIALAQLNPTVGDIAGNTAMLRRARAQAASLGADIVIATELVITGYPPEDLILKPAFQAQAEAAVRELAAETGDGGPALVVGTPWRDPNNPYNLYNAAGVLADGEVAAIRFKRELPNYSVFDEKRVFAPGPPPGPVDFRGCRLGLMVCEDLWAAEVPECLHESGADILVVINGSPFERDKHDRRINMAVERIVASGLPLIYVNQTGGQDELVFDGASFALNADRTLALQLPAWREAVVASRWSREDGGSWRCEPGDCAKPTPALEAIYMAMVTGLGDYVTKNGFPGVVLGLSGGVDSALSAAVAVDALGADRVHALMMPSRYTSTDSLDDAAACAQALGIEVATVPIEHTIEAYGTVLAEVFEGRAPDTTEENIQARSRGLIVMAYSNKFGHMPLTTGNKSEMSVGYATLYGDMCGGYSVLKDVYKTTVYALASLRNQRRPDGLRGPAGRVIPENILTKAPTAELRPDQTDQDTLPPYAVLDEILECLVEAELPLSEVVARGHDAETVKRVAAMLYAAEYKRRQAPPGVKITAKAFGRDRRYPITNVFREM